MLEEADGAVAVLACGERAIARAYKAVKQAGACGRVMIVNARFIKPLDGNMLEKLRGRHIITVEDNMLAGGFGSLVAEYFADSDTKVKIFAYADKFIEQGGVAELMDDYGLNVGDMADYIHKIL